MSSMAANTFHGYDSIHSKGNQKAQSYTCLQRCWDYFVQKLLEDSDPTWRDPITIILPTATSHHTTLLLLRKAVASIKIRTYHTASQTITEQLSTSVFRNPKTLRIQIPEWLAFNLNQHNGAQTTFNLAVFLLFSFYHGVLHQCLDVLEYSGFSVPELGGSYDACSPRYGIKPPSPEHLWIRCQSLVFGGVLEVECELPAARDLRQWDNVCFCLARSRNSSNDATFTPNFRCIQELMRQISGDMGNVVDWCNAIRTFGGSNVLHSSCCFT
ncbi:hypothetical protein ARMSODRAFT_1025434 [Armillaria solidipes]|uniref:Uncharacterized protein n=1 Tax=Armillaria solidipes TaxID=1076256 RepID=A0A2H3AYB3_9AGAR|nr:hypothetical protein ARMSODRAFT_1025434 [Armillaria solidipes]